MPCGLHAADRGRGSARAAFSALTAEVGLRSLGRYLDAGLATSVPFSKVGRVCQIFADVEVRKKET